MPIPVSRSFQILRIDVKNLPVTASGNKHVLVNQVAMDLSNLRSEDSTYNAYLGERDHPSGVPEC